MPKLEMQKSITLPNEEIKKRIDVIVAEAKKEFAGMFSDAQEIWEDNSAKFSFRAMGCRITGKLWLDGGNIQVFCNLPFLAWPFMGQIKSTINERAEVLY